MIILAAALVIFTGCSEKQLDAQVIENKDGSVSITRIDEDGKAILFNKKFAGAENVTQVKLSETSRANPVSIDLSAYEGKDVDNCFKELAELIAEKIIQKKSNIKDKNQKLNAKPKKKKKDCCKS